MNVSCVRARSLSQTPRTLGAYSDLKSRCERGERLSPSRRVTVWLAQGDTHVDTLTSMGVLAGLHTDKGKTKPVVPVCCGLHTAAEHLNT